MTISLIPAPANAAEMTPLQLAQLEPETFREVVNRNLFMSAHPALWRSLADPEVICRTLRVLTQSCAAAQRTRDRQKVTLDAMRLRGAAPAEESKQLDLISSNMRFQAMANDRHAEITEKLEAIRPGAWWPTGEGADAHRAYVAFAGLIRAVAAHRDAPQTADADDLDDTLYAALEALEVGKLTAEQFAAGLDALPAIAA